MADRKVEQHLYISVKSAVNAIKCCIAHYS